MHKKVAALMPSSFNTTATIEGSVRAYGPFSGRVVCAPTYWWRAQTGLDVTRHDCNTSYVTVVLTCMLIHIAASCQRRRCWSDLQAQRVCCASWPCRCTQDIFVGQAWPEVSGIRAAPQDGAVYALHKRCEQRVYNTFHSSSQWLLHLV